jgi:hypothetical protein
VDAAHREAIERLTAEGVKMHYDLKKLGRCLQRSASDGLVAHGHMGLGSGNSFGRGGARVAVPPPTRQAGTTVTHTLPAHTALHLGLPVSGGGGRGGLATSRDVAPEPTHTRGSIRTAMVCVRHCLNTAAHASRVATARLCRTQALLEDKERAWDVQLRAEKQEVRRLKAMLDHPHASASSLHTHRTSTAQSSNSTFGRWRHT